MSKRNSTQPAKLSKPAKPYPEFPLFPHASGRWAKKIRGKLHYFGKWHDPDAALAKFMREKEALFAGLTPDATPEGLTVGTLCGKFLTAKKRQLESSELTPIYFDECAKTCARIIKVFRKTRLVSDIRPAD